MARSKQNGCQKIRSAAAQKDAKVQEKKHRLALKSAARESRGGLEKMPTTRTVLVITAYGL